MAMPVLEDGLFATTPIALNEVRAEDGLSYQREGNFFEGPVGTIAFIFSPSWSAHELSDSVSPHLFSCSDALGHNAVDLLADATHGGCVTARVIAANREQIIRSDVFMRRGQTYLIALRWAAPFVELVVNGYQVASMEAVMPATGSLSNDVFLGKSSRLDHMSAFGAFESCTSYASFLSDYELRALAYESAPTTFGQFRFAAMQTQYDTAHWPAIISTFLLRYPSKFQQSPPRWLHTPGWGEGDFRDDLNRALGSSPAVEVVPEEHAQTGRTDVLFTSRENETEKQVRVEYKIWGRNDYRDIPEKPLKYFRAGDRLGAVFMINTSKRKSIGDEYRRHASAYSGGCLGLINLPFGDNVADHFVTFHELPWGQVEVLHVVMDLLHES